MRFTEFKQSLQLFKYQWPYVIAILLGLIIGGVLTSFTMRAKDEERRTELVQAVQTIEQALDWQVVEQQSLQQINLKTPEWRAFKSKLQGVCLVTPDCQWIYLMYIDGQDNLREIITSESDIASVPPNTIYQGATPEFKLHFKTLKSFVEGPTKDADGVWVGAVVAHKVANVDGRYISIGLDIDAKNWQRETYFAAILPVAATLAYLALISYLLFKNYRQQQKNLALKNKADQLFLDASYDQLTGLANRALFEDRLKQECYVALREPSSLAVLFMDLDGFKLVNDTQGHKTGDDVLKAVAKRIAGLVRSEDTLARFGGDEFVLMLPRILNQQQALVVAEKILAAIQQPLLIGKSRYKLGISIGYAIFPHEKSEVSQLIRAADEAMYFAKKQGKNQVRSYADLEK